MGKEMGMHDVVGKMTAELKGAAGIEAERKGGDGSSDGHGSDDSGRK